uniref:Uncharacterized protein n=1 Tax=Sus scrofa TaxID=9823 RepID=A0A8D1GZU2_PIG
MKTKLNQGDLIKLSSFCTATETLKKGKTTYRTETIAASKATDKGSISKICKELRQRSNKNTTPRKLGRGPNRHFLREDTQAAPGPGRSPRHPDGSRAANPNCTEAPPPARQNGHRSHCRSGRGAAGALLRCWGERKLGQRLWRTVWRGPRKPNTERPCDPATPRWASIQRELLFKRTHAPCVPAALFTVTTRTTHTAIDGGTDSGDGVHMHLGTLVSHKKNEVRVPRWPGGNEPN